MTALPPEISIIVPVFNCEKTIDACLESLLNQDFLNYEIIIVDDGSTDKTPQICQSKKGIQTFRISNGGPSRARNIGVAKAKGKFVAFTDGDCIVHQLWLKELQKGFLREDIVSTGGNQISPQNESDFGKYVQDTFCILGFATSYMKTAPTMSETFHNPSCNSSYRISIFQEVGGFDESLWPGEDVDLDQRLILNGYSLTRNPEAIVQHYRPQSLSALAAMMQRYGKSAYQLLGRYGFFRTLHYIPFISLTLLLCTTAALLYKPSLLVVLLSGLSGICLLFIACNGFTKRSVILLFLSLHIFFHWHLGFFKQFFFSEKSKNQAKS